MRRRSSLSSRRILDGDDGLGGEIRHQSDLLVGKRPDFLTVHGERTDQFVLLQQGDGHGRPYTPDFYCCNDFWNAFFDVGFLCRKIGDVNRRFDHH